MSTLKAPDHMCVGLDLALKRMSDLSESMYREAQNMVNECQASLNEWANYAANLFDHYENLLIDKDRDIKDLKAEWERERTGLERDIDSLEGLIAEYRSEISDLDEYVDRLEYQVATMGSEIEELEQSLDD